MTCGWCGEVVADSDWIGGGLTIAGIVVAVVGGWVDSVVVNVVADVAVEV